MYIYIYIYNVEKDIQFDILYIVYRSLFGIFSQGRAQCLPLFLRGGWGGQQLGGAAPIVFQLLIQGILLLVLARIRVGVRVALPGPRTVVSNRRLLRQSWCHGSGLLKAGPSGEERGTPHYMVSVSPQCPQKISLLTPPVFQGAAVSSEQFSQSLPPGNLAELRGSTPLRGSLERPSPAGPPLQGTELAVLSTPEASLERLVPLVDYLAAWKLLPNVSRWVMHTVEQGYRGALPPPFNGVTPTLVGPEQALVMEQEVSTLLRWWFDIEMSFSLIWKSWG